MLDNHWPENYVRVILQDETVENYKKNARYLVNKSEIKRIILVCHEIVKDIVIDHSEIKRYMISLEGDIRDGLK
jgi:hypothetical protein